MMMVLDLIYLINNHLWRLCWGSGQQNYVYACTLSCKLRRHSLKALKKQYQIILLNDRDNISTYKFSAREPAAAIALIYLWRALNLKIVQHAAIKEVFIAPT